MTVTLSLPMPPNIANGSHGHWRTRHRQKTQYWALLTNLFMARLLPDPPAVPFSPAGVTATFYLGARMDTDNLFRRAKWPMDWLVRNGYLVDDRDDHLVWQAMPRQVVKRGQEYRIELTITSLADSPHAEAA